jgi:hypothetical protein
MIGFSVRVLFLVFNKTIHANAREGYLFRATGGGIMRVTGLAPVDLPGVENLNVTSMVNGHMAYRAAIPRLLRECGWIVESDEFTEIEDPDPENHERRQRELINEIEEARKELAKKEQKKGRFSFFTRKKNEKKSWEMYDENSQKTAEVKEGDANSAVLFDVDAIVKEVAELAAQGIQVKELESTLPPMKLEVKELQSTLPPMKLDVSQSQNQPANVQPSLRETKSYNDSIGVNGSVNRSSEHIARSQSHELDDRTEFNPTQSGEITMTFDSTKNEASLTENSLSDRLPASGYEQAPHADLEPSWTSSTAGRPTLKSHVMEPANASLDHNAWADVDDEDFGKEKDIQLSFA